MTIEQRERNLVRYVFALVPFGNTVREIQLYRRNLFISGVVSARAWPVMLPLVSCTKTAIRFRGGALASNESGICLARISAAIGATWMGFRDLAIQEIGEVVVVSSRIPTTQLSEPVRSICRSVGFETDSGDFPLPAGVFYVCRTGDLGGRALSALPAAPRSAEFLDCRTALYRFRFRSGESAGASWTIRYGPVLRTGDTGSGDEDSRMDDRG